jgi:CRP-like cAMP-binding protein
MADLTFGATTAPQPDPHRVRTRRYRRGDTLIHAGSEVHEWIAISRGAVRLSTPVVGGSRVAVATLWFGDVVGCGSPLGKIIAGYDVHALVDVETVAMHGSMHCADGPGESAHLYTSTAARMNRQIAMRLAGNGPQRFTSVLATLAAALIQRPSRAYTPASVAIPIGQACLGELAGLSRRQVWIYLGELAKAGWIRTSRTQIDLLDVSCWLLLQTEVERLGLSAISTIENAIQTLSSLGNRSLPATRRASAET